MIIGLASPRVATSFDDGLARIERLVSDAAARGAEIVAFPEAYLPGLRGQDFDVIPWSAADGSIQGYQAKTQLDPTEDQFYVPGDSRRMFEVNGVPFGIAICHEGWRYPETVRWAATRGAKVVFHPQLTGYETRGPRLTEWGAATNPYYEKAMMMRSIENAVWFASVNYALRYQEAATSIIDPSGQCHAWLPYGEEGVLVSEIDTDAATGILARRYAPDRYRQSQT